MSSVFSKLPLTYNLIRAPSYVATIFVHSSLISVDEVTVFHFIPSKTVNQAIFDGGITL